MIFWKVFLPLQINCLHWGKRVLTNWKNRGCYGGGVSKFQLQFLLYCRVFKASLPYRLWSWRNDRRCKLASHRALGNIALFLNWHPPPALNLTTDYISTRKSVGPALFSTAVLAVILHPKLMLKFVSGFLSFSFMVPDFI